MYNARVMTNSPRSFFEQIDIILPPEIENWDDLNLKELVDVDEKTNQAVESMNAAMYVNQEQLEQYGSRTVPSQEIKQVDRRDRIGEDTELTDRLEAATKAQSAPEEKIAEVEERTFEERQKNREVWKKTLSDVKELLDDDLDL